MFPDFWGAWQPTITLAKATGNHPEFLSGALLVGGILGYLGAKYHWTWGRRLTSLIRFVCWGLMVVVFMSMDPIATPGVACYSAFAIGELMSYVNHVIGLDENEPPLPYQRRVTDA
jgi:hypothetical protein